MALPSRFTIMTMMIVMTILITHKEKAGGDIYDDFCANFDDLDDVALPGVPNHPQCKTSCSWRVPRLPSSVTVCTHSTATHTSTHMHKGAYTLTHTHVLHTNRHTQKYTQWKLGCPHQYELLWPKPSIVFIARNTVRILSHKLYPSKHEECLCLWLLAQSHNTLLWALTLDWKNEKAAKCQKTKCVFCSDPFLARPFPLPPPDSLWQVHFSGEIDPSLSFFHSFSTVTFVSTDSENSLSLFSQCFFYQFHCFHILMLYFMGEIDPSRSFSTVTFDSPTLKHQFHISIKMHLFLFNEF